MLFPSIFLKLTGHVRQGFMARFGGLINTDIIVIDEMEEACARDFLEGRKVLPEDIGITVLKEVMRDLARKGELHFYSKVCGRYGFLRGLLMKWGS